MMPRMIRPCMATARERLTESDAKRRVAHVHGCGRADSSHPDPHVCRHCGATFVLLARSDATITPPPTQPADRPDILDLGSILSHRPHAAMPPTRRWVKLRRPSDADRLAALERRVAALERPANHSDPNVRNARAFVLLEQLRNDVHDGMPTAIVKLRIDEVCDLLAGSVR